MNDSRKILFIKKLLGEDVELPKVISRTDAYLNYLNGAKQELPKPESRQDLYLAYLCGMDVDLPEPISRLDMYLSYLCGEDVELPSENSTIDELFRLLIDSGFSSNIEELLEKLKFYFVNDILSIDLDSKLKLGFSINENGELIVDSKLSKYTAFKLTSDGELEVVYSN